MEQAIPLRRSDIKYLHIYWVELILHKLIGNTVYFYGRPIWMWCEMLEQKTNCTGKPTTQGSYVLCLGLFPDINGIITVMKVNAGGCRRAIRPFRRRHSLSCSALCCPSPSSHIAQETNDHVNTVRSRDNLTRKLQKLEIFFRVWRTRLHPLYT